MQAAQPDSLTVGPRAKAFLAEARAQSAGIRATIEAPAARHGIARLIYERARDEVVQRQLASTPLERLRDTTSGRVRFGPIEAAGHVSIASVLAVGEYGVMRIDGVGEHSARQVIAAARQVASAMTDSLRLRFEADRRPDEQTHLLLALRDHNAAEAAVRPIAPELQRLALAIDDAVQRAGLTASRLKSFFAGRDRRRSATAALRELENLFDSPETKALLTHHGEVTAALAEPSSPSRAWHDYDAAVAHYNGMLIEVGELAPELDAVEGFIPTDIARRVHACRLDTSGLKVSLRGYQAFGAKFALVQRRVILGDEMGLGKTIEALAAMNHIHVEGGTHFLVVCPASVLINWMHETQRHSPLRPYRLQGDERERNRESWMRSGGVAVTTFEGLRSMEPPDGLALSMLVVDEAHYIKNPDALRTRAVVGFIGVAERTLFMTGTPMENRVDEFKVLVQHLDPRVAARVNAQDGILGSAVFRATVAPVYLRRNQSDVLDELPPRIETEEWVDLSAKDMVAYREAVASGNFMAMRQAAFMAAPDGASAKVERLLELVAEGVASDRKIVVFSYFRSVLERVVSVLGDLAVGPITGSVPAGQRQGIVDDFTAQDEPGVLVCQIEAGGVGLNIQTASMVILTEPQWKPTSEDQAIARCHRMGQARSVDVYRLLAEDSVDERMREILARKSALFDEFVRHSDLKDATPDAVDVSDVEATKEFASQAEAERAIIELERRRLNIDARVVTAGDGGGEHRSPPSARNLR